MPGPPLHSDRTSTNDQQIAPQIRPELLPPPQEIRNLRATSTNRDNKAAETLLPVLEIKTNGDADQKKEANGWLPQLNKSDALRLMALLAAGMATQISDTTPTPPPLPDVEVCADGTVYRRGQHRHRRGRGASLGDATVQVTGGQTFVAREQSTVHVGRRTNTNVCAYNNTTIHCDGHGPVRGLDGARIYQRGNGSAHVFNNATLESTGDGSVFANHNATVRKTGAGRVELNGSARLLAHTGTGDLLMRGESTGRTQTTGLTTLFDRATLLSHTGGGDLAMTGSSRATTETSGVVAVTEQASVTHNGNGGLVLRDQGQAIVNGHGVIDAQGKKGSRVYHHGTGHLTVSGETQAWSYNSQRIDAHGKAEVWYYGRNNTPITVEGRARLYAKFGGRIKARGVDSASPVRVELSEHFLGVAEVGDHTRLEAFGAGTIEAKGNTQIELRNGFQGRVLAQGTEGMTITATGGGEITISGKGTVILDEHFRGTVRAKGDVVIQSAASQGTIIAEGNCRVEHKGEDRRCKIIAKGGRVKINGDATVDVSGKAVVEEAYGRAQITVRDEGMILDAAGDVEVHRKDKGMVRRARGGAKIYATLDFAGLTLYDSAELYVTEEGSTKLKRKGQEKYVPPKTPSRIGPEDRPPGTGGGGRGQDTPPPDAGPGGGQASSQSSEKQTEGQGGKSGDDSLNYRKPREEKDKDQKQTSDTVIHPLVQLDLQALAHKGVTAKQLTAASKQVVDSAKGGKIPGVPADLSPLRAQEIATILLAENMEPNHTNIAKAQKRLQEVEQVRKEYSETDLPVTHALELLKLMAKNNDIFKQAFGNKEFISTTAESLAERLLKPGSTFEREKDTKKQAETLQKAIIDIFRDQLNFSPDEIPPLLQQMRIEAVPDATSTRVIKGKDGPVIQIPEQLFKKDPAAAVREAFAYASGVTLLGILGLPGNLKYVQRALKPVIEKIVTQAESDLRAKQADMKKKAGQPQAMVASEVKVENLGKREPITVQWDGGETISWGKGKKLVVTKEAEDLRKRKTDQLAELKEELAELEKEKVKNEKAITAMKEAIAAVEQDAAVLKTLQEALEGKDEVAKEEARKLVKKAVERGLNGHADEPAHPAKAGRLTRATAVSLVLMAAATAFAVSYGSKRSGRTYSSSLGGT